MVINLHKVDLNRKTLNKNYLQEFGSFSELNPVY